MLALLDSTGRISQIIKPLVLYHHHPNIPDILSTLQNGLIAPTRWQSILWRMLARLDPIIQMYEMDSWLALVGTHVAHGDKCWYESFTHD